MYGTVIPQFLGSRAGITLFSLVSEKIISCAKRIVLFMNYTHTRYLLLDGNLSSLLNFGGVQQSLLQFLLNLDNR